MHTTHSRLRRTALVGVLATALTVMLAFAASALALSGSVIKVAEPIHFGSLSVAVNSAGTAFIAWPHEVVGGEELTGFCVIPAGETRCTEYGNLPVVDDSDKNAHIEQVQTLIEGTTVVVLVKVYGTEEREFEPMQEWQSTDNGATFAEINEGKSVADADVGDTEAVGAVVVPGADALGYAAITPSRPQKR